MFELNQECNFIKPDTDFDQLKAIVKIKRSLGGDKKNWIRDIPWSEKSECKLFSHSRIAIKESELALYDFLEVLNFLLNTTVLFGVGVDDILGKRLKRIRKKNTKPNEKTRTIMIWVKWIKLWRLMLWALWKHPFKIFFSSLSLKRKQILLLMSMHTWEEYGANILGTHWCFSALFRWEFRRNSIRDQKSSHQISFYTSTFPSFECLRGVKWIWFTYLVADACNHRIPKHQCKARNSDDSCFSTKLTWASTLRFENSQPRAGFITTWKI